MLTDFLDAPDDVVPALLLLLVVAAATHVVPVRVLAGQAAQPGRGPHGDGDDGRQDGQILHLSRFWVQRHLTKSPSDTVPGPP